MGTLLWLFLFFIKRELRLEEIKLKNLRLLFKFMEGKKLLYLGALISIGLATIFTLLNPLVLRIAIDSIIEDQPLEMPGWVVNIIKLLGGKGLLLNNLWILGIVIVLFTVLRGLFLYFKGKWAAVAAESMAKKMREALYDHLQHLSFEYHVQSETGDLIQRCTSDLETIRRFLALQFVEIGRAIFMVGIISYVLFSLNQRLAFVALIVVPFVFLFAVVFFLKIKKAFKLSDEAEASMSTVLQENLTGVRVVRAFARQQHEVEKFDEKNVEYRDLTYRLIYLLAWYWGSSDLLSLLQIGLVLVLGSYWAATGVITLGTLVVFTTYEGMLLWPVRQMGRILTDMGKMFVSLERIGEILDQPREEINKDGLKPDISGEMEFENVSFSYKGEEQPVLKDISFDVKKGQTVALLGPTGSGKSSLVYLLAGLYDYNTGSIKIDGHEINNINKKWLRDNVGLVLQEPFLFARSIKENISLAQDDTRETKIFEAARTAAVHDVILEFDDKYETFVGEQGVSLSGGQKQRVAIARTLLKDPPILVFDDSLSAVDTETDAAIREALQERNDDITTFIISHRVTTLAEADLILVLEEGEIVQQGSHRELLKQPGMYERIWKIQNSLEEEMKRDSEIDSGLDKVNDFEQRGVN
jgi:ATP-binding cassette subfamily B protein